MPFGPRLWRTAAAAALPLLAGLGAVMIFRSPSPPPPAGPFAVGTMPLGPGQCAAPPPSAEEGRPAPEVSLWYPAAAPRRGGAGAMPVDTRSPLPVLLYFSGWPGTAVDNRLLVRDLASLGFVVATVTYPARRPGLSEGAYERQLAALQRPMSFTSEAAFRDTVRRADKRVRQRAEDAVRILDLLANLGGCDPADPLAKRLDTARAGIFGFSLGGAVAAEACRLDPRFKAAINMDGWHFADAAKHGVDCPYLRMSDATPLPSAADLAASDPVRRYTSLLNKLDADRTVAGLDRYGGIALTIAGTRHMDFSDAVLRRTWLAARRSTPARRVIDIVETYAAAFFEKHLAGKPAPLLAGDSAAFPEVRVEVWTPPAAADRAAAVN